MSNKILVTYATRTGSTAGVAEVIGKTLAEGGAVVDVQPVQAVTDLVPYHAVVVGSAIRDKKWLPEAMQFVRDNQVALSTKPFATFLVCMTLQNQNYHGVVAEWLQPVRQLVKPVSEGIFAGVLDMANVSSPLHQSMFRINVWTGTWSEGDHRDWEAVQTWASDLSSRLQT